MGSKKAEWEMLYETALQINQKGDHESAAKILSILADEGYSLAQYMLALYYEREIGVPKDYSKAVHYYKLAADQGLKSAMFELAGLYETGLGVSRDDKEAAYWYKKYDE